MRPFKKNKPEIKQRGNYAFIDSQNLNLGTQKMGWKMDWKKFREFLRDQYNVEKAFMFIGYMPDYEKLYDQLHSQGYLVVLKPTLEMFATESKTTEAGGLMSEENTKEPEEKKIAPKGNVDADLVLYVLKEMPNYHKAVVVSGDGDFYSMIEYLDQKQKLHKLLTPNWQYSSLLKPYERYIERLDQKRKELRYHDHHKRKPNQKPEPQQGSRH
ncbi:NYN domain-containing protein [Candidatus Saccharibacteria bacterium]|nr:NYN domain-containing protein [Candidatus Saccharibacteria bacterium]